MSKYEKVANDLRARIKSGEFKENNKMPTEDALMKHYQVSRNTLRAAMKLLLEQGKIYSIRGSGYYVRVIAQDNYIPINETKGLSHDFPNSDVKSDVISVTLINADEQLSKNMGVALEHPVYQVIRVRLVNDVKFALEYSYYDKSYVPYLGKEIAEGSIYRYLKEDLKLRIGFTDKHIAAVELKKDEATYLGLKEGQPALLISDRAYLETGEMFNLSMILYNYKYAHFYVNATK